MGIREACGVVGIYSHEQVSYDIFTALRVLQHRGQESAGISVFDDGITTHKGMGLVTEVFTPEILRMLKGNVGIGHVRYSTEGASVQRNAQPIEMSTTIGEMALGHNGELVNASDLREEYKEKGWAFFSNTDSELIIRILAKELHDGRDPVSAIKRTMDQISGSYSLVLLINNRLFAIRDPLGIKPLVIGKRGSTYMVASETVVFDALGAEMIRDVHPGEIVEISGNGISSYRTPTPKHTAHCFFEWVYFARSDSIIDGVLVYDVRRKIGNILAREHPVEADLVIPVPDSGRAYALGYSEESGIKYAEGLIKNRYVDRTFIMPEQKMREFNVSLKLNPIKSMIDGKRIVLVDDSIVRGTTMGRIVSMLRKAGAKEVHVRIGCPKIIAPCYLGIDMKTREQLIAARNDVDAIRRNIGADSLGYLSIDGLIEAIGKPREDLCLGCITGEYPVQIKGERLRGQRVLDRYIQIGLHKKE